MSAALYVDELERLEELVKHEPAQAKAEIAKHLDGELTVRPRPLAGRERRTEICGRDKLNSLLECLFALKWFRVLDFRNAHSATTYWVDLVPQ